MLPSPIARLAGFLLAVICIATSCAEEAPAVSPTWQTYLDEKTTGQPTTLPDYSHAGYALSGESWQAAKDLKIFDVTMFGAQADDGLSDRSAVEAAVVAATEHGGGVVLFPKGRFLMNEEEGLTTGILIESDHVVLRGAGTGPNGTELYMRHPLSPTDPKKLWSTPKLFTFRLTTERNQRPILAHIVGSTARETYEIEVDDSSKIAIDDYVILYMHNPAAVPGLLDELEPWKLWSSTIKNGIRVSGEKHRVVAVDGQRITFAEPIHTDIDSAHGWTVRACPMGAGWGVEDLTFRGEALTPFVHHASAAMDSGWSFLQFDRGLFPTVRRCRFVDGTQAVGFAACYGATAINCSIEGRQGHDSILSGYYSYGTLIAFCIDHAAGGTFHGYGANQGAVGTVIYRSKNSDRGLDWHASGPYATLTDASSGGLLGNGGNHTLLPNHLQFLTLWNYQQTAGEVFEQLDWWKTRQGKERYSFAKVVKPTLVGFHGLPTTFLESSCERVESLGAPVLPQSLFEAQLELRTGRLPEWIDTGQRLFDQFLEVGHFDSLPTKHLDAGVVR